MNSSKPRQVALFGGSFNPIANHHLSIAKQVLQLVDEVWIYPCYRTLSSKTLESAEHRLEMCKIAVRNLGLENIKVNDFEIRYRLTGSPNEIFKSFLDYHQDQNITFYFLMGTDNADNLAKWVDGDRAIHMIPFIIYPRNSSPSLSSSPWYLNPPHIYLNKFTLIPGSSTEFRQEYKISKSSKLVDSEVLLYIQKNQLFI